MGDFSWEGGGGALPPIVYKPCFKNLLYKGEPYLSVILLDFFLFEIFCTIPPSSQQNNDSRLGG